MSNWVYDPSQYKEKDFPMIPVGDHRVRISDVNEKTFSTGNTGFEIVFEVSGYNSRLWYNLVLDAKDPARTNQKLGEFFESFGITNYNLGSGKQWIGLVGGCRVKHGSYNEKARAEVSYFINKNRQEKLPAWKEPENGNYNAGNFSPVYDPEVELPSDLPFELG